MNVEVPKLHWSQESTLVANPYVTPHTRMQTTVCQTREEEKDDLNNTLKIILNMSSSSFMLHVNLEYTEREVIHLERASRLHSVSFQRLPLYELICELCTMSGERERDAHTEPGRFTKAYLKVALLVLCP